MDLDINVSNRYGASVNNKTKQKIKAFSSYFHGGALKSDECSENNKDNSEHNKDSKPKAHFIAPPPPKLSREELQLIKFESEPLPEHENSEEEILYQEVKDALDPALFKESLTSFSLLLRSIRGYQSHGRDEIVNVVKRVIKWRHEVDADKFLNEPLDKTITQMMSSKWPTFYCGSDKYGHPVLMERINQLDIEAIVSAPEDQVLRMRALMMEAVAMICKANSVKRHYESSQMIWVMDLNGLEMSHASRKFQNLLSAIGKDCDKLFFYTVFRIYIVNTPFVFRMIWSLVAKLMSPITLAKVVVLGDIEEAAEKLKNDLGMSDNSWTKKTPPLVMNMVPAWCQEDDNKENKDRENQKNINDKRLKNLNNYKKIKLLNQSKLFKKQFYFDYDPYDEEKELLLEKKLKIKNDLLKSNDYYYILKTNMNHIYNSLFNANQFIHLSMYLKIIIIMIIVFISWFIFIFENYFQFSNLSNSNYHF